MSIYLDYSASAPIDLRVLDFMVEVYKNSYGNADSRTHEFGENARKVVENARGQVAKILGISKDEVFFTSGATESNNIAVQGLREYAFQTGKRHIITTSIEHKAVLEAVSQMQKEGFKVDYVNPDLSGSVLSEKILKLICSDTLLVSIMHVNNETGIIQPVREIGDYLADREVFFHVDATQSFGKLVDELRNIKYDILSMSAHKMGGPQGIGALILRKRGYHFPPVKGIMYGGQQERGIRPGTIPVALAAGLGRACEIASQEYRENQKKCEKIRDCLLGLLRDSGVNYEINGNLDYSVPNTISVCFPGVSSEALMISSKQYCGVSNGSACNSSFYKPSYVLAAMGISADRIESSIRVSWGAETNINELKKSFSELLLVVKQLAF